MGGRDKRPGGSGRREPFGPDHQPRSNHGKPGGSSRAAKRYGAIAFRPTQPTGDPMRGPEDVDLAAIEAELTEDHPWLLQLDRGAEILSIGALHLAWARAAIDAADQANALPDPARTIVSDEKDARQRARQPFEDTRQHAASMLEILPTSIVVGDLKPLLSDAFHLGTDAMHRAGLEAMIQAIRGRRGHVRFKRVGRDLSISLYLDGAYLKLRDGRIPPDAFFRTTSSVLLKVQQAYYQAATRRGDDQLSEYVDQHPWIVQDILAERIAAQRRAAVAAALPALDPSPEAAELRALVADQRGRAENVRATVASSMVPLAIVASFFAIEGAADLFLNLFPFGKAAGKLGQLVKSRKAARALTEADSAAITKLLDKNEAHFLQLARHLRKTDLQSLDTIVDRIKTPELVNLLLVQRKREHLDLSWLARKLDDGTFDRNFVEHFTRFDANPTWNQLRGVIENRIDPASRKSVMSKLIGFLGEEAAARYVHGPAFKSRFFKPGERTIVHRGEQKLDLIISGDEARMLFGETKNLSAKSWNSPSQRQQVIDQLTEHNKRIEQIIEETEDREIVAKVLFVTERGYSQVNDLERVELEGAIKKLGWTIEMIPGEQLESADRLINRLRKRGP